jgi:hypothetical protein
MVPQVYGQVPYPIPPKYDPRHNDNIGKVGLLFGVIGILSSPLLLGLLGSFYMGLTYIACLLGPVLGWTALILGLLASFRGSRWGYAALVVGIIGVFISSWIIIAILMAPGV